MSEELVANDMNTQLILIAGFSASGKSASLRNLRNQERWLYLNTEAGKRLPFRNKFQSYNIEDPYQIWEAFDAASPGGDMANDVDGIIIDCHLYDGYAGIPVCTSISKHPESLG